MARIIKNLWIMIESGVVLFDYHYDIVVDPNLFGPMMSALTLLSDGGLTSFELGKTKSVVYLYKKKVLLFIANCSKKVKEKKVNNELDKIADKFFAKYPDDYNDNFLMNWTGEIGKYEDFEEEIADSLMVLKIST